MVRFGLSKFVLATATDDVVVIVSITGILMSLMPLYLHLLLLHKFLES